MFRRAALVTFVSALLLAVACGRQITPEPNLNSSGDLSGHVLIRFRVNGTLAFSQYDYQIVIDTCGQGAPLPNPATNSYKPYTFSFNAGTSPYGVSTVYPLLFQYILRTGTNGFIPQFVTPNPTLLSFSANDNGLGSEFELIFDRAQLEDPLGSTALPCASSLGTKSAVAEAPTSSSGAAPHVVPAGSTDALEAIVAPAAAATTTPNPTATLPIQATWKINFIVLTPSGAAVDSLGPGGPNDTQFSGIIVDTQTASQQLIPKTADISGAPTDPNASIAGGEVDNFP